jgi:hypothetical protein
MRSREKIEAALSHSGTPEIPAVICYEGIYVRDRWDDLTHYPWWYRHAPDVERQITWRREVIGRLGQDWIELPFIAPRADRRYVTIEDRPDGVYLVDEVRKRVQRLQREAVGGWSEPYAQPSGHADVFPDSREQIERRIPRLAPFDPRQVAGTGRDDLARALLAEFGADIFPIVHVDAPLWATYGRWGFEGMMVTVASRPELVEIACERLLAARIRAIRAAAALGAAGIWIEDCMTDMVSHSAFGRLNVPFVRALADEIRAQRMQSIHYFCGNPAGKWDLLLSTGVDALALEEGKKGFEIDIAEVVDRVRGRCALLGNLDAIGVLPHADEETLRAEIARQIAAGRRNGSRFVMSIGSPVTPGTPPQRVRLYCDMAHELGSR